ncbi:hypothetical protein MAPG_00378 [Magnaporthiopsis poae ATCC 64411]|uniref:DUF7492 domain-containing protein n=1 Tax=Magnaporthiopsis poae (strain ATCC 64411 / 73-15) TaxID=644358 RepID=A0A0C4DKU8_MAGP6|nr:hypothetical protein MAPG_00378 [Magnaporthiopsis poae ATCC 64411]
MKLITATAASALLLLSGQQLVDAHSWVEQLKRIGPSGKLLDPPGFSRGFVPRTGDANANMMKIVGSTAGQPLCNPATGKSVANGYKDPKFPKLKAAPNDVIALRYLENGHVTKWMDSPPKPKNQGTVYIYATTKPKDNEKFDNVHKKWTADGNGGDKSGWLLATRNYDDGRCFEDGNPNADQRKAEYKIANQASTDGQGMNHWCQNDIQLPDNVKPGQDITLYWVWDYSTISKRQGAPDNEHLGAVKVTTPEFYSSCMEVAIVDECSPDLGEVKGPKCNKAGGNKAAAGINALASSGSFSFDFNKKQDLKLAAIPEQLAMGRFQVKVNDAPAGGNGGNSPPPGAPTPAPSLPLKPSTTTAYTSTSTHNSRIKYVTVTKGITTVYVTPPPAFQTVTVTVDTPSRPAVITTPASSALTASTVRPRGQGWYGAAR